MQAQKHTFKNGLRLLVIPMKGTASVTVMAAVAAGSRYEDERDNGLSHFMEHMFFKGARRYPNTLAVSSAIEGKGGVFNAFTGNELVAYHIKLASEHTELACDVLSDMLLHAKCAPNEINRERGVIIEEINMYEDQPDSQVGEDFARLLYGDHPLGRPIAGPKKNILHLQRRDFLRFRQNFYTPDNIVVAMAGDISRLQAEKLAKKYFRFQDGKKARTYQPFVATYRPETNFFLHQKKTEQAHFLLGGYGYNHTHKLSYAAGLLSVILGGGMSSRLFLEIRERRGLCYYIHSTSGSFHDTGTFYTAAGVNIEKAADAIREITKQYRKMVRLGVSAKELRRAKDLVIGRSALGYENSYNVAGYFTAHELLQNKLLSTEETARRYEAVTASQIKRVAQELLAPDNLYCALIGPFDKQDERRFAKMLPS